MTAPASPQTLSEALRHPDGGMRELGALVRLGAAAIPVLLEAALDPEARVRGLASVGLGQLATASAPVVRALRLRLDDDSHEVRAVAARALGALHASSDDILQRLAQIRKADPSPATRSAAQEALLVLLGSPPGPAVSIEQLLQAVEDRDPEARDAAVGDLGRRGLDGLTPDQAAAVEAALLERLARDDHHPVRMSAALAVWKLGRASGPVIAALATALGDPHAMVQIIAAQVLGNFGPRAAAAVAALDAAVAAGDRTLAPLARQSLHRIRSGAS